MAYLLDTNVFIQAKNLHYGFDFCPAFWEWIDEGNRSQVVFSIEQVGGELIDGADELAQWAGQRGDGFFLKPEVRIVPSLQLTSQWANGGRYQAAAVNTFLQSADYHLVANAHAYEHVVVTHEIASTSVKKIKIPDACTGLGVRCVTPFEMLRTEKARFVLGVQSST